ncbi:MAG: VanZ family protein, partial [Chloroflexi bacterium]|nr:VanZ family protein [Chloroflexota bacterium]
STEPSSGLGSWTWMPFEDLIRAWPSDWARHVILDQMAANVLLFVPFGLALTLRSWRVPLWRVAIVSAAFSIGIELTQGVAGNGRSADITDVLMNMLGGICGWAVGRALLLLLQHVVHEMRRSRTG